MSIKSLCKQALHFDKISFYEKTPFRKRLLSDRNTYHRYRHYLALAAASVILGIAAAWLVLWMPVARQASAVQKAYAEKLLRLHVLANSDSDSDQALKLKVRDAVLAYMAAEAPEFADAAEASQWVSGHMDGLEKTAREVIAQNGFDYDVALELGTSHFPVKTYGSLTFPAGEYQALRILIGEGAGKNWWCVMYPPLCFVDATCVDFPEASKETLSRQLTDSQYRQLEKPPVIKWKILELMGWD